MSRETLEALEAADEWDATPKARELLAKLVAFETEADRWYGRCDAAAKAFSDDAEDIEGELDTIRTAAIYAAVAAADHTRASDEWFEAVDEAEDAVRSVKHAIAYARRERWGEVWAA